MDGYTDLRGRFDYTSLSTNPLDAVARFSLRIEEACAGNDLGLLPQRA